MRAEPWFPMTKLMPIAAILVALSGCSERRGELREWTPADHQPAPEGAGVPEEEGEGPSVGASLFSVHCASCHGATGRGDGPAAPPMANVPDLTDPERAAARTDADVEAIILAGRGFMPGFERTIPIEGIREIVAHVRTLSPITAVTPGAPPGAPAPTGAAGGSAAEEAPEPSEAPGAAEAVDGTDE